MQVVLSVISLGLLGLIIYFAVSPKSSRILRLSAFAALGLIGISLVVCGIFIIRGPGESAEIIPLPVFEEAKPAAKSGNMATVVVFFIIFVLVLALIVFLAIRDQKKKGKGQVKGPEKEAAFSATDELEIEDPSINEDDSFDIEME